MMESNDYRDIDVILQSPLNRREFLKRFGGGILIFFSIGDPMVLAQRPGRRGYPTDFNAYLRIGTDNRVTCLVGKIEMGQGIITSLAQMLADELDISLERVDMVMGDTDLCPWDMGTFGSLSTRAFGPYLRQAGAEARAVLLELASEHLGIPQKQLKITDGVVFDKTDAKNKVTYTELTKGRVIERYLEHKPPVKTPSEFNIMNRSFLRRDSLSKVTGEARFAGDIQFPDMLYARILRPPAHGAKLQQVDISAAENIAGIQIVQECDFIAALHKHPDDAEKALEKIVAQFDLPEAQVNDQTIFDHLLKNAPEGEVVSQDGDIPSGESLASTMVEATFLNSYVAHAPLETHTAVAKIEGEKVTVWASTQTPFGAKEEIAQTLGVASDNVRIITPFVGGGFGGKTRNQQAVEAARLAKWTGKPIQVAWTRGEEFFYDTFRPAAVVKIKSGLSNAGNIVSWDYRVYFAGDRGAQHFYDIPHHRTVAYGGWSGRNSQAHPFRVGAWRAPANNTNTFARESHIDMLAEKAGQNPLEFRLQHLKEEKMRRVVQAAAEKFGWTPSKAPSGRGIGMACGIDAGTYVAHVAEVEVDKTTGQVQVKRVVCAQDMGLVVNPAGAVLQIEGCVTMGLGYALTEEIHFNGGQILDLNFDTYEMPLFSWVPQIETVLIDGKDDAPQGGGEPAIICMGAVIANAIYDAIGVRLFQLPMTPERIRQALKQD